MTFDPQRLRVEERKLFGPFYSVRVFDTVAGRRVPWPAVASSCSATGPCNAP